MSDRRSDGGASRSLAGATVCTLIGNDTGGNAGRDDLLNSRSHIRGHAARLVERLWHPTYRQGRIATLQRWSRWLDGRDGIAGRPLAAVQAALTVGTTGPPADAERYADMVDRWLDQNAARPEDPTTEGWAAVLRAIMCRHGVEQMRVDADEATCSS